MSDEEIALRLTEAWAGQSGLPTSMSSIVDSYKETLKKIKNIKENENG